MRYNAKLTLKDATKLDAETIDLSMGGVSLFLKEKIRPGQYGAVLIEVPDDKLSQKILAVGQIVYCVAHDFTGGKAGVEFLESAGFKTGLQFLDIDPNSVKILSELLAK